MKTVSDQSFDVLFNPKNVMIIEAKEKVGFFISGFKRQGFDLSNLYLVSPNKEELYNIKCYSSIDDVPVDDLDLVILSIRREFLIQSLNEILTKKNVKYIHIFTAGTGESGKVGKQIELEIKQIMNDHENTRAIGPNCMGLYSPRGKIAYYSSFPVERGNIGLIFQSGDLHSKMVKFGSFKYGLTFSLGVSIGNCVDIQISELVRYYNNDEETDMICVYFEGISQFHKKEGINLFRVLKNVRKPVFFMRGGKTTRGQSAVLTHTGSVATDKRIFC